MEWNAILKFLGSVGILSGALIYLGKLILTYSFEAGKERYKQELEQKTEQFKTELQKDAITHQIRYSKLYEERGEVIKQIYRQLDKAQKSLEHLTHTGQGPDWTDDTSREVSARHNLNRLQEYLDKNKIFFKEHQCQQIEVIVDDGLKAVRAMEFAKDVEKGKIAKEENIALETWLDQNRNVREKIKEQKKEVTQEFRKLIGVEEEAAETANK